MRCEECSTDNTAGNRFCTGCGTALPAPCPSCGLVNPAAAKFCGQCGSGLRAAAERQTIDPILARPSLSRGERKQVTVLFADVSQSTQLIEPLDPEQALARLAPAIEAMRTAVRRYEGTVVQIMGDGVMALFGAPQVQEDHAVRACGAALSIQSAVRALPAGDLAVRIGIHSGEVLARTVATDLSVDYGADGLAVHIAARMEKLAEDGGIALSQATWRMARHFVDVEPLGPQAIRGLTAPMEIYRLVSLRRAPASQRFREALDLTPLVGRERELSLLEAALGEAGDGEARIVGLVGDAGVGKSRLAFEFAERCRTRGIPVLEARAMAHSRATPFEPVIDLVRTFFRLTNVSDAHEARTRVAVGLRSLDPELAGDAPLVCDFLGIADPDAPAPTPDAAVRRERLLRAFRRAARAVAQSEPAVLVFEDLHWLDSGSEVFVETLAEAIAGTRMLLVTLFRPGYSANWMRHSFYQQVALQPLKAGDSTALVDAWLGGDPSVAALGERIGDRARGNPFFVEELVRALADSGHIAGTPGAYRLVREPGAETLSPTLQALIGTRIDSRPEIEKTLLQSAAVIGREFMVDILQRVVGMKLAAVQGVLQKLSGAELIYEVGPGSTGVFAFKHPLVQEVAYRAQLAEQRRQIHGRVAAELETSLPDASGAQAGYIGYHWEEAGNLQQAGNCAVKAAMWHGTRDAAQALDAWMRAARLLKAQPLEGAARFVLVMASGQVINFAWRVGKTAAEVLPYYDEAMALAREIGDMRAVVLLTAAYGRLLGATGSADDYLAKVREAQALLALPRDASLAATLKAIECHALRMGGFLAEALTCNDAATARVGDISDSDMQTLGFDVGIWLKGMRGQILTLLGRFDEALPHFDGLIADASPKVDALHKILAHSGQLDVACLTDRPALRRDHAERVADHAQRSGSPYLMSYAMFYGALASALGGDLAAAESGLVATLAYIRTRRVGLENEPRLLAELANVRRRRGDRPAALQTAQEAADLARARNTRLWLAYALSVAGACGGEATAQDELATLFGAIGADTIARLAQR